jgi:hypothetical protein
MIDMFNGPCSIFKGRGKDGSEAGAPVVIEGTVPKKEAPKRKMYRFFVKGFNVYVFDQDEERILRGFVGSVGLAKIKRDFKTSSESAVLEIHVDKEDSGDPILIRKRDVKLIRYEPSEEDVEEDEKLMWKGLGYTIHREEL